MNHVAKNHTASIQNSDGTYQLLAYADDVNILGGSVHTVKENAEALVVATKEIELEVNADRTKYMVMSRDRNAGRGHSVKIDNSSIERLEEFKYLGTTLTDQNSFQEEIKSRLKLGNIAIIPYRICCLPGCCPKLKDQDLLNYNFARGFVWV